MKGIPLMQQENVDPKLAKRIFNLSQKFAANAVEVLTAQQLEYYEKNLPDLKIAAEKGLDYFHNNIILMTSPALRGGSAVMAGSASIKEPKIIPLELLTVPAESSLKQRWIIRTLNLYRKFMGIDVSVELERFIWSTEQYPYFNWFVFCPQGLTTREAIDKLCKPQFATSVYIDPDVYPLDRKPDQPTMVLCRETVEPDKDWLNKSGDNLTASKRPFLDLRERVVLEAVFFFSTGKHLDIKGMTRCPGSRRGENVANACWDSDKFGVDLGHRRARHPDDGGREVVVLSLKS